jgi:hypothetical protein
MLMELIDYNLLFRWFVGLPMEVPVWHPTVFTKNRDRLLEADVAREFCGALMALPSVKRLMSSEPFSVDGTLIDAWASMKSFRAKDGSDEPPAPGRNGERDFRKEKRSSETHASTTDPDARLYRKGNGPSSRLCFMGHTLMENRNGLIVDAALTHATGTAERAAAPEMLDRRERKGRIPLGADKAYDVESFVGDLRQRRVTPQIALNGAVSKTGKPRKTAIDRRTPPPPRLRYQPAHSQADRGRLRLDQEPGRIRTGEGARQTEGRSRLHLRRRSLQPDPVTRSAGGHPMTGPSASTIWDKWRIVSSDIWDKDFLDLVEPAYILFPLDGRGEFAFGAVTGSTDRSYSRTAASFTWVGSDEIDEVSGSGDAEISEDGTIAIDLRFHLGDEATLSAKKW